MTFELDAAIQKNAFDKRIDNFKNRISNKDIDVIEYIDSYSRVTLRCIRCGNTFSKTYNSMLKNSSCPYCIAQNKPKSKHIKNTSLTPEEKQAIRANKYSEKINNLSCGKIEIIEYNGSKEKVVACCKTCGNQWSIRADHLINRTYCPLCRKQSTTQT